MGMKELDDGKLVFLEGKGRVGTVAYDWVLNLEGEKRCGWNI